MINMFLRVHLTDNSHALASLESDFCQSRTTFSVDSDSNGFRYSAIFDGTHFATGASKLFYHGLIFASSPREGPRNWKPCVVKVLIKEKDCSQCSQYDNWIPDISCHKRTSLIARSFNQATETIVPRQSIEVCDFLVANIEIMGQRLSGDVKYQVGEFVSIEPILDGNCRRFNRISGTGSDDSAWLLQSFSHYSFCVSGNRYLTCGLKEIKAKNRYILTDPTIHSSEQVHGKKDNGILGMILFISNHRCNRLCRALNLPSRYKPINPNERWITVTMDTDNFDIDEDK